jgi:uncharacterized membrane protein
MRVRAETRIAAPVEAVWAIAADPGQALNFMSGVTRWETVSEVEQGLGARYRMLLRVGSAEIGGLIEIVEWAPPFDYAWTSVTGIDQRGRFRLRRAPGDRTKVEFHLAYGVFGSGLSGWLAEHVAAPAVSGHLRRSLEELRRQAEHEQMRQHAAARRAPRPA